MKDDSMLALFSLVGGGKRACEGAELGMGCGCEISVLGLLAFRNYQDTWSCLKTVR